VCVSQSRGPREAAERLPPSLSLRSAARFLVQRPCNKSTGSKQKFYYIFQASKLQANSLATTRFDRSSKVVMTDERADALMEETQNSIGCRQRVLTTHVASESECQMNSNNGPVSDQAMSNADSQYEHFDECDKKEKWQFTRYRSEGKVHVFGEWISRTKSYRCIVIGPDWPCVLVTYLVIIFSSSYVYLHLVHNVMELIVFVVMFGGTIYGLTTVFIADPGLVRKCESASSPDWTYCDYCETFSPPRTIHCSTCQVCVTGYDHHLPVS
jgi:DHHC palmitoyltransferase